MLSTVAMAQSNDIIPVLALQDVAQLQTMYSRQEADALLNICGNFFCGQAGGATGEAPSILFF